MMYVFSVLILITLGLSVFSVDEVAQGIGGWLGGGERASALGTFLLMLLIVAVLALLVGVAMWKKMRSNK